MTENNNNTYDLQTIEGLTQFAEDCKNAIEKCPQGEVWNLFGSNRGIRADRHNLDLDPHMTVSYYLNHDVLWEYGCDTYLTPKAKRTVSRYLEDKNGAIYDKERQIYVTQNYLFKIVIEGEKEYIVVQDYAKELYKKYVAGISTIGELNDRK